MEYSSRPHVIGHGHLDIGLVIYRNLIEGLSGYRRLPVLGKISWSVDDIMSSLVLPDQGKERTEVLIGTEDTHHGSGRVDDMEVVV